MSSKVEILCPNGHRVYVKITQSTTILQILEEACRKQSFLPYTDYELRSTLKRTSLDVSLTIGFAGLSNNARLELVAKPQGIGGAAGSLTPGTATPSVHICLQLEDGSRVNDPRCHSPLTSLYDILEHFQSNGEEKIRKLLEPREGQHLIVVFMRTEIIGDYCLRNTRLQDLGLNCGGAALRISCRQVAADKLLRLEQATRALVKSRAVLPPMPAPSKTTAATCSMTDTANSIKISDVDIVVSGSCNIGDGKSTEISGQDSRDTKLDQGSAMEVEEFKEFPSSHYMALNGSADSSASTQMTTALRGPVASTSTAPQPCPTIVEPIFTQPDFSDFKFPTATKGMDLYRNEFSEVTLENLAPCDRQKVVYKMETQQIKADESLDQELPDNFFDHTDEDIKRLYMDSQLYMQREQDRPLQTSAMRRDQMEKRMSKYTHTTVRIVFPDRLVLQGVFKKYETVHALHKFVKDHLEDKTIKFHLYTSPPKMTLMDLAQNLLMAKLVPMALVYFGTESCALDNYISKIEMEKRVSRKEAMVIVDNNMPERSLPTIGVPGTSGSGGNSGKVPKWFKIGKK